MQLDQRHGPCLESRRPKPSRSGRREFLEALLRRRNSAATAAKPRKWRPDIDDRPFVSLILIATGPQGVRTAFLSCLEALPGRRDTGSSGRDASFQSYPFNRIHDLIEFRAAKLMVKVAADDSAVDCV